MKSKIAYLAIGLVFVSASRVAATEGPTRDEQKLESTATDLDKDSARPDGEKRVEESLEARFHVGDKRIAALRAQKLGYGEITIVLALAQKLPGGIDNANVNKILAERQGPPPMGWGRIAKKEGTSLGKIMSEVRRTDDAVRDRERGEHGDKDHDRDAKADRDDRADRADRMDRQERTERPENPRH